MDIITAKIIHREKLNPKENKNKEMKQKNQKLKSQSKIIDINFIQYW